MLFNPSDAPNSGDTDISEEYPGDNVSPTAILEVPRLLVFLNTDITNWDDFARPSSSGRTLPLLLLSSLGGSLRFMGCKNSEL